LLVIPLGAHAAEPAAARWRSAGRGDAVQCLLPSSGQPVVVDRVSYRL
jgi:hypothetical protein